MKKKLFSSDKIYIGLILGFLLPLLVFTIYILIRNGGFNFFPFISKMHKYGLLFRIISLCVLADLPVFYIFIQKKYWRGARGVVMACFFYAFIVAGYTILF
jgi:hypothetical protein